MASNLFDPTKGPPGSLTWPPLVTGTLIKRYKRFLADVTLATGEKITAHCGNSGRMTGCSEPGRQVYLTHNPAKNRKTAYSWQMIRMGETLVGVNTLLPNILVKRAVLDGVIPQLSGYSEARAEVAEGSGFRVDLVFMAQNRRPLWVEVKNCTLVESGLALFPDAVTARGKKHMEKLAAMDGKTRRRAVFFLVQREDAQSFSPASKIDPEYSRALEKAAQRGVEVLAWDVTITPERIAMRRELSVAL